MELSAGGHGCLDPDTLAAYVDGRLASTELDRADRHIDHCRSCRGELSALAAMHSGTRGAADSPIGRLGRYHVLRELGRGAMGVVVRAYDPELARAVALKVIEPVAPETRERLRREAQAMARLDHPNVVGVYDVVVEGDAMFVAMELVDGETLRDLMRVPGSRRALARACILAGRGLAAAHAAKLVHRDFKPENILCSERGDVRVSDFGLARTLDDDADGDPIAGTPAYMAPEVYRREPATPASDQFGFCVTMFEALYGRRPFLGSDVREVRERILAGAITPPPAGSRVPPRIWRALERGLATDPAARFPSMTALLDELDDDPRPRHRRWIAFGVALAAAVAAGALAGSLLENR